MVAPENPGRILTRGMGMFDSFAGLGFDGGILFATRGIRLFSYGAHGARRWRAVGCLGDAAC